MYTCFRQNSSGCDNLFLLLVHISVHIIFCEEMSRRSYHIEAETKWKKIADDILKRIFRNENVWILLKISHKIVPKIRIDNIPALVQTMASPKLPEPTDCRQLTRMCVSHHILYGAVGLPNHNAFPIAE